MIVSAPEKDTLKDLATAKPKAAQQVVVSMPVKAPKPIAPAEKPSTITARQVSSHTRPPKVRWYNKTIWRIAAGVILLPTLVVSLYLLLFASHRYAAETSFAVRGQQVQALDTVGLMNPLGGATQTTSDSYILVDYLNSREFVEDLDKRVGLRAMYSRDSIDWLSRLTARTEIEWLVDYWKSMSKISFDSNKGVVSLEVTSYVPQEAELIAKTSIELATVLINRLSEDARRDALRGATTDVERAEFTVRMLRTAMKKLREDEKIADPVASAGSSQARVTELQNELARIDTQLSSSLAFMNKNAPSVVVLQAQRDAVRQQLEAARQEFVTTDKKNGTGGSGKAVASMLSSFEELEGERVFAQQAYTTALASLERARVEADRKQRYLAVFVAPRTPEWAKYPQVPRTIILTALFSFLVWMLSVVVFYGVREHAV